MYWIWLLGAFILSVVLTPIVARAAASFGIVDEPKTQRKIHVEPIPLLGGISLYVSIVVFVLIGLFFTSRLTVGDITLSHYLGFFLGGLVLIVGGGLDDKYDLPPKVTILFPVIAAVVAIAGGVEVSKLSNPFGGIIELVAWQSNLLVFFWLMAVMYTTKLLDGLDGLDTSVVSVGTLAIMLLSLSAAYFQPDVALFSSIGLGALLGFLVWNWHPARIFLGEGGSTFVGFFLGTLAVISGGKLAIALLVLGIPLLDLVWVIIRRASKDYRSVVKADRKHLHHRLLDLGWSQPRIVGLYSVVALLLGVSALFLQSKQKALAFLILIGFMVIAAIVLMRREKKNGI
ncbi:MAG: MraY family glycosyltransferase [bacterium]|nr:MraY family glycosyltransferase [bacterium]